MDYVQYFKISDDNIYHSTECYVPQLPNRFSLKYNVKAKHVFILHNAQIISTNYKTIENNIRHFYIYIHSINLFCQFCSLVQILHFITSIIKLMMGFMNIQKHFYVPAT